MPFLVLQHIAVEHPGTFASVMAERAIPWQTVALDEGAPLPPLADYDALLVLGGPMDVWDEEPLPWLKAEKAAIREWVLTFKRPFLGVCLGHQLLAEALGGAVAPMPRPEVGLGDVVLSAAGRADPLFAGLPAQLPCLHWHGAEVTRLPQGGVRLAGNGDCAIQAFAVGERAYGLQFHLEVTAAMVAAWSAVPAYRDGARRVLGPAGEERLQALTAAREGELAALARRLFSNFCTLAGAR